MHEHSIQKQNLLYSRTAYSSNEQTFSEKVYGTLKYVFSFNLIVLVLPRGKRIFSIITFAR